MSSRTVNIDDMCWPLPDEVLDHRLRYCKDQITNKEKMRAAQILAAYARMVEMNRDERQKVIAAIRLEQNQRNRWEKKQKRVDESIEGKEGIEDKTGPKECICGKYPHLHQFRLAILDPSFDHEKLYQVSCCQCRIRGPVAETQIDAIKG